MESLELTQPNLEVETPAQTAAKPHSRARAIWRRLRRSKLGLIAGAFLMAMALLACFAGFISPYGASVFHADANAVAYDYVPPMMGWIHFEGLQPYVHGLQRSYNPLTGVKGYVEDVSKRFDLKFFVRGEPYLLLGFIPTDIHLLGTGEPDGSSGQLFLLGTDRFGRDLLSRILYGSQLALAIGPLVVLLSFGVGILFGGLSGYYGGKVDTLIQRGVEVAMSLPRLALLLALSATLPPELPAEGRFWGIVLILSLVGWAPLARVLRGQVLALREQEFVQASRALGASDLRILFKHILPNTSGYLIVAATLAAPGAMLLESTLSFFGFGLQEPLVSWGLLMADLLENFQYQIQFHPWLILPGCLIFLCVMAFNFLGDALRDAMDPFRVPDKAVSAAGSN